MSTFKIPVTNTPQKFNIALAGREFILTCKWNDSAEAGWVIDLDDAVTNTSIVANLPLVTGIDILAGLEYLELGGKLFIFTDGDDFAVPTLDDLGNESNLYFVTQDVA